VDVGGEEGLAHDPHRHGRGSQGDGVAHSHAELGGGGGTDGGLVVGRGPATVDRDQVDRALERADGEGLVPERSQAIIAVPPSTRATVTTTPGVSTVQSA
jgi:hypothetical protein